MTSAGVRPALGLLAANGAALGAEQRGLLAEPATNEDVLEVFGLSGSEDLAERAGVELMDHLAVALGDALPGVGLKLGAHGKGRLANLLAVLVDNAHVARGRGRGGGSRVGRSSRLRRCWSGRLVGLGGGGRCVVDRGSRNRGVVIGGLLRGIGGLRINHSDGLVERLNDPVDVLDLLVLWLVLVVAIVGGGESNAGEGGEGEGGAHIESCCCCWWW